MQINYLNGNTVEHGRFKKKKKCYINDLMKRNVCNAANGVPLTKKNQKSNILKPQVEVKNVRFLSTEVVQKLKKSPKSS